MVHQVFWESCKTTINPTCSHLRSSPSQQLAHVVLIPPTPPRARAPPICGHVEKITKSIVFWCKTRFLFFLLRPIGDSLEAVLKDTNAGKRKVIRWEQGGRGDGGVAAAETSKTSPFNFLKTFQHLFCTLTYANSKGPLWLGSHFRPSVEPESSSAVKWERRSAVWKWISLAEIRGALSEPCTALNGGKELLYKLFLVH